MVIRRGRRRHRSTALYVSGNDPPNQKAADVSRNRSASESDTEVSSRVLTNVECRSLVSNHDEGRLGYQTGRGPRAVAVSYAVTDDQVVSLPPEYNEIFQYGPGYLTRPGSMPSFCFRCVNSGSHLGLVVQHGGATRGRRSSVVFVEEVRLMSKT